MKSWTWAIDIGVPSAYPQFSWQYNFSLAKETGISYVEPYVDRSQVGDVKVIRQLSETYGLPVSSVHGPWLNIAHPDPQARKRAMDTCQQYVLHCKTLGARILVIHSFGDDLTFQFDRHDVAVPALTRLANFAHDNGVLITIENIGELQPLVDLLEEVDKEGKGLAICFDTGSSAASGCDIEYNLERAIGRIKHIHVHDALQKGIHKVHLAPGDGIIDWQGFLNTLTALSYTRYVVLETLMFHEESRDGVRFLSREESLDKVMRGKMFMEKLLG